MCCQSWRLQTFEKQPLCQNQLAWTEGTHGKQWKSSRGKRFEGNILSLYHEGSRLSVDTFGVAACVVCPEADVVFPCGASARLCTHAHLSVSYCVCGLLVHPTQGWYTATRHVAVAEQTPCEWASFQKEHPWLFITVSQFFPRPLPFLSPLLCSSPRSRALTALSLRSHYFLPQSLEGGQFHPHAAHSLQT